MRYIRRTFTPGERLVYSLTLDSPAVWPVKLKGRID